MDNLKVAEHQEPAIEAIQLQISHLHDQDQRLRSDMHTGFESLGHQIGALSDDLKRNTATNWPVLIAIMGFLLSVVTIIGAMALGPLKKDNRQMMEMLLSHTANGHPATVVAQVDALQSQVINQRDSMRRELDMRFELVGKRLDRIDYEGSKVWDFVNNPPKDER